MPAPVPAGPDWWDKLSTVLLENWTGILGAVVLVTGVGFLGIYAALRLAPPHRFLLICGFAMGLLGARFALREKAFAQQLNTWLLSSAAAIFLFACVGSVSIDGLRWATPPFEYLLLLAGVCANLFLAWRSSREAVATLHGVLSLVALAVLPPSVLTLAAAAGVTAFSIAITYRQLWKYQLLLSIASFFAFHLYWHQELAATSNTVRLTAMALVLLVGVAAALVQYRSVYAKRQFEPLLFAAHLLNWTTLGISLYLHSTGSVWKTIPLALGALLTFWAGRRAKQLGIGWLFQTDTIISLILALATAFSLQGWHASPPVVLLFMLLEALLITLVMARQREVLVYRVALTVASLAGVGLLLAAASRANHLPADLYRDALVLALAGWAGLAFVQLIYRQPLLAGGPTLANKVHRELLNGYAGICGVLQAGAGLLLARALFGWESQPVPLLLVALLGLAAASVGLALWVRTAQQAPGWVRQQQLLLGQYFAVLAVFGLHETGLNWPVLLGILYAENLLAALLLARQRETLSYHVALTGAYLSGTGLLLVVGFQASHGLPPGLYRNAFVLTLAGWAGLFFTHLVLQQLSRLLGAAEPTAPMGSSFGTDKTERDWLSGFAGLAGLLQVGAGLVLARALFAWQDVPAALLLAALLSLAAISVGLAAWLRTSSLMPGWVRQQQLLLGQFFAVLAVFGLHELGLGWPVITVLLYLENLLVALVMARKHEDLLYRIALAGGYVAGLSLLLLAGAKVSTALPSVLYRDALWLALAGWAGIFFIHAAQRQLAARAKATPTTQSFLPSSSQPDFDWLGGFAGLAGLLQAGAGLVLARVLFGWAGQPVGLLLVALVSLAAMSVGLAAWLRRATLTPTWVRQQQLVLGQFFALLAVLGLHEMGLGWPVVYLMLYAEHLLVALVTARQREGLMHRLSLAGAYVAGISLLVVAGGKVSSGLPATLYRDALWLALAGWAGILFLRPAHRLLAAWATADAATAPATTKTDFNLLGGLAGLAGLLQVGTGVLLARVVFGWEQAPVWALVGALLGLAAAALGLATWLRASKLVPGWVRQQQLVLAQGFATVAIFGLHETGLSWPLVLGLLYAENLAIALLAVRRGEGLLYHLTLAGAFFTGTSLLLVTGSQDGVPAPTVLYRNALVLALAGWAGIAFAQLTYQQLTARKSTDPSGEGEANKVAYDLLGGFAALAGLLLAGVGLLLGRSLFAWYNAPAPLVLGGLLLLAGASVALATWVHTKNQLPAWVRRQQLVLGQFFTVLAVFGLHEIGLSWPAVFTLLYAENLLLALLLTGRDEDELLHAQTYLLVLQALVLPLLVRSLWPGTLESLSRAGLLAAASLLTAAYQARRLFWPRAAEAEEYGLLRLGGTWQLSILGVAVGWLLLGAGTLLYQMPWAAWAMVGMLGGLLWLRARTSLPGVWAGVILAGTGYLLLQWGHVLTPARGQAFSPGYVLLYLLPTLAVPAAGLLTSWWAAGERFVRWPWVYLLGAHGVVALVAAVPAGHVAYFSLGLLSLAAAAFLGALAWRKALPHTAAVLRAGQPDRYLLHLGYWLLSGSFLTHLWLLTRAERFFGQPAEYYTAALLFALLATWASVRPPATAPVYNSWRRLQPWLPEAALLFGSATLGHNVRTSWLPLLWAAAAVGLGYVAARVPLRFRRLGAYSRLYYWLAAGTAGVVCLFAISPAQLLSPEWWESSAAVALLFGYVWLALAQDDASFTGLSPAWNALARPPRRVLEAWLLYPAFLALSLLLIQSFGRSVLTVLLMLEVVAVFSTSLLLRRQDLRYLSLAGMLACLVRLVFFDLSRSGTITRAIVFILMGLLLLGMNALYARFKTRFAPEESEADDSLFDDLVPDDEPQVSPE
jgi:hypothetical protein